MANKKTSLPQGLPTSEETASNQKKKIMKESFVEQELLGASVVQKELMATIRDLNTQLGTLNTTLNLIREHEFVEFHKSKWRIIAYQIALGMLFAIGTVVGLASISWATYTFFKDNEILRQIVDKQLESRNFNFTEIRNRATKDAGGTVKVPGNAVSTGSFIQTGAGKAPAAQTGTPQSAPIKKVEITLPISPRASDFTP